ncbi:methylated-DNA--[protein]-cysteine S-methyltransferase [bacterium]|nr:methylated-DNA--[protein]-cysteine S-methyltransferase [bacterium]
MEKALLAKDSSYDGIFYAAITSTRIFCRPSCSAKKPLLKNVEFFPTPIEALQSGFRPCLRCRPMDNGHPDWVQQLIKSIELHPDEKIYDDRLRSMGIPPEKARRYFIKHFGMTFQAFARSRRLNASFGKIRKGSKLDDVILSHGYDSHSGFRDAFVKIFGRPPGKIHASDCITISWTETPIGPMVVGATSDAICFLEYTNPKRLEEQSAALKKRFQVAIVPGTNEWIEKLNMQLGEYFKGERKKFDVPLIYPGTPFEEKVWNALLKIPYGETRSYEELAKVVGSPLGQRAVGRANGLNRIAIVIPCHRVVNKSGELGGYGGGLWRKQRLLELETGNLRLF